MTDQTKGGSEVLYDETIKASRLVLMLLGRSSMDPPPAVGAVREVDKRKKMDEVCNN